MGKSYRGSELYIEVAISGQQNLPDYVLDIVSSTKKDRRAPGLEEIENASDMRESMNA